MKEVRMTLRYPIRIHTLILGEYELTDNVRTSRGDTMIEARGATTDDSASQTVGNSTWLDEFLLRDMERTQKDQCARECRNLWGPIWKYIWKEEWDANAEAMREEREKALAKWRKNDA